MDFDPASFAKFANVITVGPVVIDFGKDHWMEILGAIIVVLALILGVRLIDRILPARKPPGG